MSIEEEKIKLTEEHENCECNDMLKKTDVCMPEKCHIIHEDYLDLFDYYEMKSKKYDDLMSANNEWIKTNISSTELFQKNKELKEKLEEIKEEVNRVSLMSISMDYVKSNAKLQEILGSEK